MPPQPLWSVGECGGFGVDLLRLDVALVVEAAGPPDPAADVEVEGGDQDRADDEGVQQDPEGDGEADLGDEHQREGAQGGEGPGQDDPGRGDDPAGGGQPDQGAAAGAVGLGFLMDSGHEEDVVVGAQRDQKDKGPQRERRVGAGEAEQVVKDQRADPQRGRERQHDGGDQQQRRHDGAQDQGQDDQHHQKDQGDDQVAVVAGGPLDVEVDRAAPPDLGVGAGDGVDPGAEPVHGVKA